MWPGYFTEPRVRIVMGHIDLSSKLEASRPEPQAEPHAHVTLHEKKKKSKTRIASLKIDSFGIGFIRIHLGTNQI